MLRITALSDFVGVISQKHLIALVAISILAATTTEIAGPGQRSPLIALLNTCTMAVLLLALAFFVFVSRNSVIIPRYGSADLFLSVLLVVSSFVLWLLVHRSLTQPGSFHPVFFILGGVTSLVFSGSLAVLLPLTHKIYAWLPWP
jgi:hypothetical protein